MEAARRKTLVAALALIDVDNADSFATRLDRFDKVVVKLGKAERAAEKARTNFSAEVLKLIQDSPGSRILLDGLATMRSGYSDGSPEYSAYNTAMARCRAAFRRITESRNEATWAESWDDIVSEAEEAPNFTQFERGAPEARGNGDEDEAETNGRKHPRVAKLPPRPATIIEEVEEDEWPPIHQQRFTHFEQLVGACVVEGILSQAYADGVLSLVREGVLAGLQGAVEMTQPEFLRAVVAH